MGSRGEPSAIRDQRWQQPGLSQAADGCSHPLLCHHGSMSRSHATTHMCCWDMFYG